MRWMQLINGQKKAQKLNFWCTFYCRNLGSDGTLSYVETIPQCLVSITVNLLYTCMFNIQTLYTLHHKYLLHAYVSSTQLTATQIVNFLISLSFPQLSVYYSSLADKTTRQTLVECKLLTQVIGIIERIKRNEW